MSPRTPLEEYGDSSKNDNINSLECRCYLEPGAINSCSNGRIPSVQVTQVVDKDEPRISSTELKKVIMAEVRDILERDTFKVILKEEIADGPNALTARYVLAIKSNAVEKFKYKARYATGP